MATLVGMEVGFHYNSGMRCLGCNGDRDLVGSVMTIKILKGKNKREEDEGRNCMVPGLKKFWEEWPIRVLVERRKGMLGLFEYTVILTISKGCLWYLKSSLMWME